MIVVDATVWVDKLRRVLPDEFNQRILTEGCASPPHVDFEVGAALLRLERRGDLDSGQARELIDAFADHPVERARHRDDGVRAVGLTSNATYAGAWYVALAKRLGCPVMTSDAGLAEAARIGGVEVVVVNPAAPTD